MVILLSLGLLIFLIPSVVWFPPFAATFLRIVGLPLSFWSAYRFGIEKKILTAHWIFLGKMLTAAALIAGFFLLLEMGAVLLWGRSLGVSGILLYLFFFLLIPGCGICARSWLGMWPFFGAIGAYVGLIQTPDALGLMAYINADPMTFLKWFMRPNLSANSDLNFASPFLFVFAGLLLDACVKAGVNRFGSKTNGKTGSNLVQ